MADDLRQRLVELLRARSVAYAEAEYHVNAAEGDVEAVAEAVVCVLARPRICLPLGERSYYAYVLDEARDLNKTLSIDSRASDAGSQWVVADTNTVSLLNGFELAAAPRHVIASGESAKTLEMLSTLWRAALDAKLTRTDTWYAVGGGVVGDVTGFAAGTFHRGAPYVQVPTTLLAMVDAAFGGKTAINFSGIKNVVGMFHHPRAVYCALSVLRSLPERHYRAGLAEAVKSLYLAGSDAFLFLEKNAEALRARDEDVLRCVIDLSLRLKAGVVSEDERDVGMRHVLNLGHTFAHAIEALDADILHGEAVAIGLVLAECVACAETGQNQRRLRDVLSALRLPLSSVWLSDREALARAMAEDKKRSGSVIDYALPHAPGRIALVPMHIDALLRAL